jgi:molybdenum cofactor cytidylyltransferase
MHSYGLLILGAGSSSRLGQPKQLLQYRNISLIRHVAGEAILAITAPVMVVTGSNADLVEAELADMPVQVLRNKEWEQGMGHTISTGVQAMVKEHTELYGIIIMVCDQPFVNGTLLREMISLQETTSKGIIACFYDGSAGTPVLFTQTYFPALIGLDGTHAAKTILQQYPDDLALYPFPLGALDIDTAEDYQRLLEA